MGKDGSFDNYVRVWVRVDRLGERNDKYSYKTMFLLNVLIKVNCRYENATSQINGKILGSKITADMKIDSKILRSKITKDIKMEPAKK